jgi:hypothetical protein
MLLKSPSFSLAPGETIQLSLNVWLKGKEPFDAAGKTKWVSSAPGVVTIDGQGRLTGVAGGVAEVKATFRSKSVWAIFYVVPGLRTLAVTEVTPKHLRFSDGRLYWVETYLPAETSGWKSKIMSIPLEGGPSRAVVADQPEIAGLEVDGSSLYWLEIDHAAVVSKVKKMSIAGGEIVLLAGTPARIDSFVVRRGRVYWAENPPTYESGKGRLMAVPAAGGPQTVIVPNESSATALTADNETLFWLFANGVKRSALDGKNVVVLAREKTLPHYLAAQGNYLYYANRYGKILARMLKNGKTGSRIASGQEGFRCLSVDDSFVCWATDKKLMKIAAGGGQPVEVAAGVQDGVMSVLAYGGNIYWLYSDLDCGAGYVRTIVAPSEAPRPGTQPGL